MLGKLIKYEFKATSRIFIPLILGYLGVGLLARGLNEIIQSSDFIALMIIWLIVNVGFSLLNIGISFFPIFSSASRFNKNLMGNEGYLMNTLPVSANKLVLSKFIVSASWYILSAIGLFGVQVLMLVGDETFGEIMELFKLLFGSFIDSFTNHPMLVISIIILIVTSILSFILQIYASICLGQLSNSARSLKAVLIFIGLFVVSIIFSTSTLQIVGENLDSTVSNYNAAYVVLWIFIGYNIIFGGLYYYLTQKILKTRLNIQ